MMVDVKLRLWSPSEITLFAAFSAQLEAGRLAQNLLPAQLTLDLDDGWKCYSAKEIGKAQQELADNEVVAQAAFEQVEDSEPYIGIATTAPAAPATAEDAGEALRVFLKSHPAPKAVEILKSFGVARVGELAPETRGDFIARLQATGSIQETL